MPVMSACEKGMQWQQALRLFASMLATIRPSVISLNAAMAACQKCMRWQEALNLFIFGNLQMNIQADIISFATAITCCEQGMQWYHIIRLLGSAIEMSTSSTSLRHPSLAVKEKTNGWGFHG